MVFKKRRNELFQIAQELYNSALLNNRVLKPDEIKKAFKRAPYEPLDIDVFLKDFMQEDYGQIGFGLFVKAGNGYRPSVKAAVPTVLAHDEAAWLKTMLEDEKIDLFLDKKTQRKIGEALAPNTSLYGKKDIYIQKNTTRQDFADENLQRMFKTILRGIAEKKLVRFEYIGRENNAQITALTALPLKMYYHGVNDTFQCIVFDIERKHKSTLNMERIADAAIIDKIMPDTEGQPTDERPMDERPPDAVEVAEIELRNEKNIPLQCFMLLSDYQKTVVFDDARNLYKITVQYYEFERQDLLKNLLYFGSYCAILSPDILVRQIKQRLEKLSHLSEAV